MQDATIEQIEKFSRILLKHLIFQFTQLCNAKFIIIMQFLAINSACLLTSDRPHKQICQLHIAGSMQDTTVEQINVETFNVSIYTAVKCGL